MTWNIENIIIYKQWVSTDHTVLVTVQFAIDDFLDALSEINIWPLPPLLHKSYNHLKFAKENLDTIALF